MATALAAGEVMEALAAVVAGLDVAVVSGDDAARLTGLFARGERLCATAKAMAARRAAQCRQWERGGHRGPEAWLAEVSGSTAGAARASLAVAEQMAAQPELAEACQAGELSAGQAAEIAAATQVDPDSAGRLIEVAGRQGWRGLRDSCRQVVGAGRSQADDEARRAGLHAGRYVRWWTDRDGAGRLEARLTPEGLARVQAGLRPFQAARFAAARRDGSREKPECYLADALVAAVTTAAGQAQGQPDPTGSPSPTGPPAPPGPPATVIAVIDHAALVRGFVQGGEGCQLKGIGPVPVASVRALLADAFVAAVVRDGIDIRSVVHLGRQPTAAQRTALYVRDRTCVGPAARPMPAWKPTT